MPYDASAGELSGPVAANLNGLKFETDLLAGHKTGLYLDQQVNYQRVAELATQATNGPLSPALSPSEGERGNQRQSFGEGRPLSPALSPWDGEREPDSPFAQDGDREREPRASS